MTKKIIIFLILILIIIYLNQKVENFSDLYPNLKPFQTILINNNLTNLTLDQRKVTNNPLLFNKEIKPMYSITDQKSSGRCWIFAAFNLIRIITNKKLDAEPANFQLSENYLLFWDKYEKYINGLKYYAEMKKIDNQNKDRYMDFLFDNILDDGGNWNQAANLIKKYGIVPRSVMPETYNSNNTGNMNMFLTLHIKNDFKNIDDNPDKLDEIIESSKTKIYDYLVGFLGQPPNKFNFVYKTSNSLFEYKDIDPKRFLNILGFEPDNWILVTNDVRKENPYYKFYSGEFSNGCEWLNLPMERIRHLMFKMVESDTPVFFGCDISNDRDFKSGVADYNMFNYEPLLNFTSKLNKEERLNKRVSTPNHAVILVGYYKDAQNVPLRWKAENSWGTGSGENGYFSLTSKWIDEYGYFWIVPKSLLTNEEISYTKQIYKYIPPWDPMGLLAFIK